MYKKIKVIIIFLALLCGLLQLASPALAADLTTAGEVLKKFALTSKYTRGSGEARSIEAVIGNAVQAVLVAFGIAYFIFIIYGGFMWQIAHGERDKVDKAKNVIKDSTIGMAIILGAYALSYFIINVFIQSAVLKGS